jgi:anti-anti-sigma regulatory factor
MLMITVETEPTVVTLRLEGRLAGPEARELSMNWNRAAFKQPDQRLSFDLTGVSFVDVVGIEFLARAHREGDTLIGGATTSAIVDEIITRSRSDRDLDYQRIGSGS